MLGYKLKTRKYVLKQIGFEAIAARNAWSHDLGQSIAFDAWEHLWKQDDRGRFASYPLRTNGSHYDLAEARTNPKPGHTKWQKHVDLILAGQRRPRAIVPVPRYLSGNARNGAKGMLPLVVEGHAERDGEGQVRLYADKIVQL